MPVKNPYDQLEENIAGMLTQQTADMTRIFNQGLQEILKEMATQGVTLTQVQADLATLQSTGSALVADVTAAITDIAGLSQQIQQLQAAGGATPAQLAALDTSIQGITSSLGASATSLQAVLPANPAPAAPAPAAPTET
jgi:septal ring factor EnvC (AmiA/AmiB activator)